MCKSYGKDSTNEEIRTVVKLINGNAGSVIERLSEMATKAKQHVKNYEK